MFDLNHSSCFLWKKNVFEERKTERESNVVGAWFQFPEFGPQCIQWEIKSERKKRDLDNNNNSLSQTNTFNTLE